MSRRCFLPLLVFLFLAVPFLEGQSNPELVQVVPPPVRRSEPPSPNSSTEELERRGDELRAEKAYLDALDYYIAAQQKDSKNAEIWNKRGITELLLLRYKDARKNFERAIHFDHNFADAHNNLGVIFYLQKKYPNAVKQYETALKIRPDSASYYSNLGAAYFSKKEFEKASSAYSEAVRLDPDVFERTSHTGIAAQMASPEDRAHFEYVLAKLFAKQGDSDRSLEYLKRAMEEGYKGINDVYKDPEFEHLRSDARFTQLMAARPPAIPE
ncbi:MAG TPA: tetratricopeptide repeat protein [Terriglobales bacterium]|nr:tetratricopeptide repeat protein [Terriglobales bacterium]